MHENNMNRKCSNPDCGRTISLCPDCFRPLIFKKGPIGEFWGCTGFNRKASNPCRYTTTKIPDGFIGDESIIKESSILDLVKLK